MDRGLGIGNPWIVDRGSGFGKAVEVFNLKSTIGIPRCSLTPPQTHPLVPSKEGTSPIPSREGCPGVTPENPWIVIRGSERPLI